MKVNEIIKKRRKELGLTLKDVANELNVSESLISRYESNDVKNMGIDKLIPLAKVLNTTPAYLMGWEKGDKREIYDFYINENLAGDIKYKNKKISIIMGDPKDKSTFKELDLNSDENIKLCTVISLIQLALEKVELTNKGRVGLENLLCDIIEYFFIPKESITPRIVPKKHVSKIKNMNSDANEIAAFHGTGDKEND